MICFKLYFCGACFCSVVEGRKCVASLVKLRIVVPEQFTVEAFRERVLETLLYPGHWITKTKDNTYCIEDESGNRINNVNIETIIKCNFKEDETSLNIDYIRLEGMPEKIAFNEIQLYKPSTKETSTIIL
ncbi:MAG: hypothetical protein ACFCUE_04085 [Candidatus Bathyarchaeia archaeon]|jgi:hypothetical protein